MSGGEAAAAAAIAAAKKRREEEGMTTYTPEALAEDWEFKILRSAGGRFRRSEFLAEVLEQEARAGWQLVEKFDHHRIRLKRPRSARENDRNVMMDPYRSYVGMSDGVVAAIVVVVLVLVATVGVILSKG